MGCVGCVILGSLEEWCVYDLSGVFVVLHSFDL